MERALLTLAGIISLSLTIFWFLPASETTANEAPAGQQAPVKLSAVKIQSSDVVISESLPGRIVAYQMADIRPQVSGIVVERLFTEGANVKEGEQLYQIDPAPYQAAFNSAKADLEKAKAVVKSIQARSNRYEKLVEIEAVSKQDYDDQLASLAEAKADIAIAKAAVESAKIDLDYTKVYAPISGRIGKSNITKGALVTEDQAESMATITQLNPIYVDMTLSSTELIKLRQKMEDTTGIPVSLHLDGSSVPIEEKGTLQFHEVTVDRSTGAVQLRALFPNPNHVLLPGLFVRAQLELQYEHVLLVPQRAAQRNPDGSMFVWVVEKDGIKQTPIQSKQTMGDSWIVSEGLKEGDIVLTEGHISLAPGMLVDPIITSTSAEVSTPSQEGNS